MKEKFKRVKDRQKFFIIASEKTGVSPRNIQNNWFGKLFIAVPKCWIELTNELLDKFQEYEKEKESIDKKLHTKYFGN